MGIVINIHTEGMHDTLYFYLAEMRSTSPNREGEGVRCLTVRGFYISMVC